MRTDATSVCTRCARRFGPARACPKCGLADRVLDLRDPSVRQFAAKWMNRRPWWLDLLGISDLVFGVSVIAGIPVLGYIVVLAAEALGLDGTAQAWGAALAGGVALYVLIVAWARMHRREATSRRPRPIGPPAAQPDAGRVVVRGRIRPGPTVSAPLTGAACIAFRVCGESRSMILDEAGGTDFELEIEGEPTPPEVIAVDLSMGATIEVPVEPIEVPPGSIDPAGLRFLQERGLDLGEPPRTWRQGLLRAGDEVEIEATAVEEPVPEGYRETSRVRVLREHPGSPLHIRL